MIVDCFYTLSDNDFRLEPFETITTGIKNTVNCVDHSSTSPPSRVPYRRFVGQSGSIALVARWTGEYPVYCIILCIQK